jgi:hypothetical protein
MTNIRNFPIESRPIGEVAKGVLEATGKAMCERLDGKAESYRQSYLKSGDMKDLLNWAGYARQADSARITYGNWKRGKS